MPAIFLTFSCLNAAQAQDLKAYRAAASGLTYAPVEKPEGLYACQNRIMAGVKVPGVLNIAVALGYSDLTDEHLDLVTDVFTLDAVTRNLTNPCVYKGQGFCGFKLAQGGEHTVNRYTRELTTADRQITVNVYTMNSSYSLGNSDNLTQYKVQQDEQTSTAREFYGWALQNADMVFYEGHSRDGGGPDFAPPRPDSAGTVDYPWYRANRPGLKFLLTAVDQAKTRPVMLGLYSCASRIHFLDTLEKHLPDSKLILSTKVVEGWKTKTALFRTLESALNFECEPDLRARLEDTSFVVN